MSDYYCTNCGADIGDQYGFDPEKGYWTCTVCGKLMTDPNDSDFDTPSGVTWFCDGCGACLNKQSGFSEDFNYWHCTECGYDNKIGEDNIFDSKADYQNCKDDDDDDDDLFDDPHRCYCCGKLLNKQSDYSDVFPSITCSKCGTWNSWDDEDDEDMDEDEDEDDDENIIYVFTNGSSSSSDVSGYSSTDKRSFREKWQAFLKKLKIVLFCLLGLLGIIGGLFVWYKADGYFAGIEIGIESESVSNYEYEELKNLLYEKGFKFVYCYSVADLEYNENDKIDSVSTIIVGEDEKFSGSDKFSRFSIISIYYHVMQMAELPVSSKEAKKQPYEEIVRLFKEKGFGNIELTAEYDVVLGWFAKENEIDAITIDGNEKFSEGDQYSVDAPIVITYHAKKGDAKE